MNWSCSVINCSVFATKKKRSPMSMTWNCSRQKLHNINSEKVHQISKSFTLLLSHFTIFLFCLYFHCGDVKFFFLSQALLRNLSLKNVLSQLLRNFFGFISEILLHHICCIYESSFLFPLYIWILSIAAFIHFTLLNFLVSMSEICFNDAFKLTHNNFLHIPDEFLHNKKHFCFLIFFMSSTELQLATMHFMWANRGRKKK